MKKTHIWYALLLFLFIFLFYYVIKSSIMLVNHYFQKNWYICLFGLILNFFILGVEFLSSFYSIWIYYYIGSSLEYVCEKRTDYIQAVNLSPTVTVVVPIYKEPFVIVSKTLEKILELDYPSTQLDIVVIDDSPSFDDIMLEEYCKSHSIRYITRKNRVGYKAGALNHVLEKTSSSYFAVLDSDHIPTETFLKNCLDGFISDDVLLVQGKPLFVNQENVLQRSSAFIHVPFFNIYQKSRSTRGATLFAGTTGVFNTKLLKASGGFLENTLAEDTDSSFVAISKGYKSKYVNMVCSEGLVPWTPISMINQIWRWSHGLTQSLKYRFLTVWKSKTSLVNKLDMFSTTITPLIGTGMWIVNFLLLLIYYFGTPQGIVFLRPVAYSIPIFLIAPILISVASLVMSFIAWMRDQKERSIIRESGWWGFTKTILPFYFLMLAGHSFLLWAVISALFGMDKEFKRTRKVKSRNRIENHQVVKYGSWSCLLFLLSIPYYIATYQLFIVNDPFYGWFIFAAISLSIPLFITLICFKDLESFKNKSATVTAADINKHKLHNRRKK